MALQTSGAISLNEIHVEAGGTSGTTVSVNDSDIRTLGGVGYGALGFSSFFGASSELPGYMPISLEGTTSAYDTSIPVLSASGNTQITGTTYWRRVRVNWSGSSGTKRFYVRGLHYGTTAQYRGDIQANMAVINNIEYPLQSQTNWEYALPTSNDTTPSSWSTVGTSGTGGIWVRKTTSAPTGSSGTGRLQNFITPTAGYMYLETSSYGVEPAYYWLRSPLYYFNAGDKVDFYYGVDCSAINNILFYIA